MNVTPEKRQLHFNKTNVAIEKRTSRLNNKYIEIDKQRSHVKMTNKLNFDGKNVP